MNFTSSLQEPQLIGHGKPIVTLPPFYNNSVKNTFVNNTLFVGDYNISKINQTIELSEHNKNQTTSTNHKNGNLTGIQIFFLCLGICLFVLACMFGGVPI